MCFLQKASLRSSVFDYSLRVSKTILEEKEACSMPLISQDPASWVGQKSGALSAAPELPRAFNPNLPRFLGPTTYQRLYMTSTAPEFHSNYEEDHVQRGISPFLVFTLPVAPDTHLDHGFDS
jgi:hypothetical protein